MVFLSFSLLKIWCGGVGVGRSSWLSILTDGADIYWRQMFGHLVTVIVSISLNRPYEVMLLSEILSVLIREGAREEKEDEGRALPWAMEAWLCSRSWRLKWSAQPKLLDILRGLRSFSYICFFFFAALSRIYEQWNCIYFTNVKGYFILCGIWNTHLPISFFTLISLSNTGVAGLVAGDHAVYSLGKKEC